VDSTHTLYYEEYGNPNGLPALYLHGGPGAGFPPNAYRFFDPNLYRIILLDQRGACRSTPRGEVRHNTLSHLIEDCERLRKTLPNTPQWHVVFGGSWGSTLAIAYAQEYPQQINALVLWGVCLIRMQEVNWLFQKNGAALTDPKGWNDFSKAVGIDETIVDPSPSPPTTTTRGSSSKAESTTKDRRTLHAYYDRLMGNNASEKIAAAQAWDEWESRVHQRAYHRPCEDNQPSLLVKHMDSLTYQDANGVELLEGDHQPPTEYLLSLKKGIAKSSSKPMMEKYGIRPFQGVPSCPYGESASVMLACFFGVNRRYATNDWKPLAKGRIQRLRDSGVRCIAVHGGMDEICPIDTALELSEAWPEMELRIVAQAGHSCYHPEMLHELVCATDRLAAVAEDVS